MIYGLLIGIVILFIISYFVSRDVFHPICLICLAFFLSVFCAILNIQNWNINLSFKTTIIILIGLISFILPGIILYKKHNNNKNREEHAKVIKYSKFVMLLLLILQIVFLSLYVLWMAKYLGGIWKLFDSSSMTQFRYDISFNQAISYPMYISQGIKYSKALIYIYSFIEIHNVILMKHKKLKYKVSFFYIISLILFFIQTIISGGRSELILLIIAIIAFIFTIDNYYSNKNGTLLGKNFIKIAFIVLIVLYLFSFTRTLVGRTSEDNFIDYVSRYFGGSIQLFDMYLDNPIPKSNIWGKETFFGINKFLNQIGIIEADYTLHLEFRSSNGVELGNVYTSFRRMIQDFGISGLIILNFIFGFIISCYYNYIKRVKSINKVSLKYIFYFMILHSVVLTPFSDFFFSTILSINYLNIIIYMIFISFVLTKIKINR